MPVMAPLQSPNLLGGKIAWQAFALIKCNYHTNAPIKSVSQLFSSDRHKYSSGCRNFPAAAMGVAALDDCLSLNPLEFINP